MRIAFHRNQDFPRRVRQNVFHYLNLRVFFPLNNNDLVDFYRYLLYRKKLELEYDSCIYTHHPKTVILNTRQKIDLLDTRCSQDEGLKPVFSIENQDLHTYYNFAQNESIVCMAASSRDHVSKDRYFIRISSTELISLLNMFFV